MNPASWPPVGPPVPPVRDGTIGGLLRGAVAMATGRGAVIAGTLDAAARREHLRPVETPRRRFVACGFQSNGWGRIHESGRRAPWVAGDGSER
jgi:hypothetical protein